MVTIRRWAKSVWSVLRLALSPMVHLRYAGLANVGWAMTGYVASASLLAYFGAFSSWLQGIPKIHFFLIAIAGFLLLIFFAAIRLQRKVEEYETPQMEIVYSPPPEGASSFYQGFSYQDANGQTVLQAEVFRVAVVNRSGRAIENVRVFLSAFTPQGSSQLPFRLQLMNDQPPCLESREGFRLDRGEIPTQYVEVVKKLYVPIVGLPLGHIILQHVEPNIPNVIPDNRYRLTLIATAGGDVPQTAPKVFVTFVDAQGRLHFEEES